MATTVKFLLQQFLIFYSFQLILCNKPKIITIPLNDSEKIPKEYQHLPIVGKCCEIGQILIEIDDDVYKCIPLELKYQAEFSPKFSDVDNKTDKIVPGFQREEFVAIIGNPCKSNQRKFTQHNESKMHLLVNGSILEYYEEYVQEFFLRTEYCMEIMPVYNLSTFFCYSDHYSSSWIDLFLLAGFWSSIIFFILIIIIYASTPRLRDIFGKILCFYCGCIVTSLLSEFISEVIPYPLTIYTCIIIVFGGQFFLISAFFWLNIMSIEIFFLIRGYINTGTVSFSRPNNLFSYYSIWAWLPTTIIVILTIIIEFSSIDPDAFPKPEINFNICWFRAPDLYLQLPITILITANTLIFIITNFIIIQHQRKIDLRVNPNSKWNVYLMLNRIKRFIIVSSILFFILGINWMIGLVSWWWHIHPYILLFCLIINVFQGVIIFIIFVLRRPVRTLIWYKIKKLFRFNVGDEPEISTLDLSVISLLNVNHLSMGHLS